MVQGSVGNHHPAMPPDYGETEMAEHIDLYRQRDPPGEPLPINIDPIPVDDGTPSEGEIRLSEIAGCAACAAME
jgi:hypothetical protein